MLNLNLPKVFAPVKILSRKTSSMQDNPIQYFLTVGYKKRMTASPGLRLIIRGFRWFIPVLIFAGQSAFTANTGLAFAGDELSVFESKKMENFDGSAKEMDATVREVHRESQKSTVHVNIIQRGTVSGSILFTQCSLAKIAKARKYRYFIVLNRRNLNDCMQCEISEEYVIGFTDSPDDDVSRIFGENYKADKNYGFEDINESYMVCGFLPIPATEFHRSVYFGDLINVQNLSKKNEALINQEDDNGFKPLHLATGETQVDIVKFLISAGADVNAKGPYGWTSLHMAAGMNSSEMVEMLIAAAADPNLKMEMGNTPLHSAAYLGSIDIADQLIKAGSSVNETDNDGNTPLHDAAARGYAEMVRFLLVKGASPNVKNKAGKTPLMMAESQNRNTVIDVLNTFKK